MNENTIDTAKSKYFLYIAIAFVALLMISNTVAVKLIGIGPFGVDPFHCTLTLFSELYVCAA